MSIYSNAAIGTRIHDFIWITVTLSRIEKLSTPPGRDSQPVLQFLWQSVLYDDDDDDDDD